MRIRLRPVLAIAALLSVALGAQDAAPPPQPPTFRTEANYVRVDVYATVNDAPVPDLRQEDFEVVDNGVAQKIEQFEHVQIRAAGPQETRIEPNTVRESRAMLEDSRARVFVLFLDTYHVDVSGSHDIRGPLVKMLDQVIGQNDLVGVMLPGMAATDVAFARKTTTIDGFLSRYWTWGDRDRVDPSDAADKDRFVACYGEPLASQLLDRLREKRTLDALHDLVVYLRGIREERKAIITISDGWRLFTPNEQLKRPLGGTPPGTPEVGVDPRTGKLTGQPPPGTASMYNCDRDRLRLADIDDQLEFRLLLDEANRANASFYTMDPRGLVVFDSPIGPEPPPPPSVDQAILNRRHDALRTLAEATDGLAMLNSNNLDAGLKRISDDLTSYYLLGYYASAPLDGKFHKITVRVKRPGVHVRARRGYLAATAAEVARRAPAPPSPSDVKAAAEAHAFESVVAPLAGYGRDLPLRLATVATATKVWVDGELGAAESRDAWRDGGSVDLLLTSGSGETVGSGHATVPAGGRTFEAALPVPGTGEYEVRVRARPAAPDAPPINEVTKAAIGAAPSGVRYVRRGPGNREAPAADLRFRRPETLRVEWPAAAAGTAGDARLLDRTGKPIPVPVAVATRDADGVTWLTAQVSLAPLAPGDYIVELQDGSNRRLAAFRVVP